MFLGIFLWTSFQSLHQVPVTHWIACAAKTQSTAGCFPHSKPFLHEEGPVNVINPAWTRISERAFLIRVVLCPSHTRSCGALSLPCYPNGSLILYATPLKIIPLLQVIYRSEYMGEQQRMESRKQLIISFSICLCFTV